MSLRSESDFLHFSSEVMLNMIKVGKHVGDMLNFNWASQMKN